MVAGNTLEKLRLFRIQSTPIDLIDRLLRMFDQERRQHAGDNVSKFKPREY